MLTGSTEVIRRLNDEIIDAARSDAKILITGESGVGKEVVAKHVHQASRRRQAPMLALNCAGVPDTLLESELFGYERGSFTGAYKDKPGLLQVCHGGTVFLDELGEMSLRMQALLLRFLETGEVQRVGATGRVGRVDVRVVAATNRDLRERMTTRDFREDLYYRLNVIAISVPPLRDRRADIPLLIEELLRDLTGHHRVSTPTLSAAAMQTLTEYPWPGNVRQLRNVLERLTLREHREHVEIDDLPREILEQTKPVPIPVTAAGNGSAPSNVDVLYDRIMRGGESFWDVVYPLFMSRDLTRDDLRAIIARGLEQSRGSYRLLATAFHMEAGSYKRFLNFLRKYDCQLPFHKFRAIPSQAAALHGQTADRDWAKVQTA